MLNLSLIMGREKDKISLAILDQTPEEIASVLQAWSQPLAAVRSGIPDAGVWRKGVTISIMKYSFSLVAIRGMSHSSTARFVRLLHKPHLI